MKKALPIICIIIIIALTISTVYFYGENSKNESDIIELKKEIKKLKDNQENIKEEKKDNNSIYQDNITTSEESRLITITPEYLDTLVQNKETFILVLTQTDCSHCHSYKPVLKSVLEENKLIAYELDIQPLNQQEREQVYIHARISGTPTTVFFSNGEELTSSRLSGSVSRDKIVSKLKDLGYIK